ncbi:MAG: hypothetical protein Q8M98_00500 [Candidatus Cloacimonadaceae bacterium]|nr:hypothetical protein [Candidatus Cloacimonadaceae bacterium]
MQRIMIICLMILVALAMVGCEADGELRIRNRTSAKLIFSIDAANPIQLESWKNWSKYYAEDQVVQIQYQGDYIFPNTLERTIHKGLLTALDINPTGGAIRLINNGNAIVFNVFLSPSKRHELGR